MAITHFSESKPRIISCFQGGNSWNWCRQLYLEKVKTTRQGSESIALSLGAVNARLHNLAASNVRDSEFGVSNREGTFPGCISDCGVCSEAHKRNRYSHRTSARQKLERDTREKDQCGDQKEFRPEPIQSCSDSRKPHSSPFAAILSVFQETG
jgi:hypothetical protein